MERKITEDVSITLRANMGDNFPNVAYIKNVHCFPSAGFGQNNEEDVASTVLTDHDNRVTSVNAALIYHPKVIAIDGDKIGKKERKGGSGFGISEENVMYTQTVKDVHAVAYAKENGIIDMRYNIGYDDGVCPTLTATDYKDGKAILENKECNMNREENDVKAVCTKGNGDAFESDVHTSLCSAGGGQAGQGYPATRIDATVRRLMPIETERLMGFDDNWTKISWDGKPEEECPDAPRYKACGNSFCSNCIEWLGIRIEMVEEEIKQGR